MIDYGICPNVMVFMENIWTKEIVPITCKSWDCPHCSKYLKALILDRVTLGFGKDSREYYMLRLTNHLDDSRLLDDWNRLKSSILWHGIKIDRYFWVKEFTPPSHVYKDDRGRWRVSVGGVRHLHILISFIGYSVPGKELISDLWLKATGGSYQIDLKKVKTYSPAGYMLKYITKSIDDKQYFKHERRIGFSNNFPKLPKQDTGVGWVRLTGEAYDLQRELYYDNLNRIIDENKQMRLEI